MFLWYTYGQRIDDYGSDWFYLLYGGRSYVYPLLKKIEENHDTNIQKIRETCLYSQDGQGIVMIAVGHD